MLADELAQAEQEAINARKLETPSPPEVEPSDLISGKQSDSPRKAQVMREESASSSSDSTRTAGSVDTSEPIPAPIDEQALISDGEPKPIEDQLRMDNLLLDPDETDDSPKRVSDESPSSSSSSSSSHSEAESDSEVNKSAAGEPEANKSAADEPEVNKPSAVDEHVQEAPLQTDLIEQVEQPRDLLEEPDLMGGSLEMNQGSPLFTTVEATESPAETGTATTAGLATEESEIEETVSAKTVSEELNDKQQPDDTQTGIDDDLLLVDDQLGPTENLAATLELQARRRSSFEAELTELNEPKNDDLTADNSRFLLDLSPALESADTTFQGDTKSEAPEVNDQNDDDDDIESPRQQSHISFDSTTEALTARKVSEDQNDRQQLAVEEEVRADAEESDSSSQSSDSELPDKSVAPGEPDLMLEDAELSKPAPLTLDVTNLIEDIKTLGSVATVAVDEVEQTTSPTKEPEVVGEEPAQAATKEPDNLRKQSSNSLDSLTEALTSAREQDSTSAIVPEERVEKQEHVAAEQAVADLLFADELAPVTANLVDNHPEPEARRQSFSFEAELAKLNDSQDDKGDAIF